ncbi:hypothetical protein Pan258_11640 [Symmachiella dynata]|uniref:hypothetical protein n=1 Tax=Symmachiella dynata TaxID=2527995 RepID=UPI00118C24F4|nr:hypothetical protein [Symmachiella dynata]QDT47133.1 hypothetical protein Pan258_11640 [Symmachiella dynata]
MGSPYRRADLTLKGSWIPELPGFAWQDLHSKSDNGRYLALVAWEFSDNNNPGFRIVVIDKKDKAVRQSKRIAGCCQSIDIADSRITFETYNVIAMSKLADCESPAK